jgi:hypothetical protein
MSARALLCRLLSPSASLCVCVRVPICVLRACVRAHFPDLFKIDSRAIDELVDVVKALRAASGETTAPLHQPTPAS